MRRLRLAATYASLPLYLKNSLRAEVSVVWSMPCLRFCMSAHNSSTFPGPDAIKGLKATIKKLRTELAEVKGNSQVVRYKALQQDLKVDEDTTIAEHSMSTLPLVMLG